MADAKKYVLINDDEEFENSHINCDVVVLLPNGAKPIMSDIFGRTFDRALMNVDAKGIVVSTRDDVIIARAILNNDQFITDAPITFITTMADIAHEAAEKVMRDLYIRIDTVTTAVLDHTFKKHHIRFLNDILDHFNRPAYIGHHISLVMTRLYEAIIAGEMKWALLLPVKKSDSANLYSAAVLKINPMKLLDDDSGDELII